MRAGSSRWIVFAASAAAALGALSWATGRALELEARNAEQRVFYHRQSLLWLALWRVDSYVAPLIASESARPPFALAGARPDARGAPAATVSWPAAALDDSSLPFYFQAFPDGSFRSPQAPGAVAGGASPVRPEVEGRAGLAAAALFELSGMVSYDELARRAQGRRWTTRLDESAAMRSPSQAAEAERTGTVLAPVPASAPSAGVGAEGAQPGALPASIWDRVPLYQPLFAARLGDGRSELVFARLVEIDGAPAVQGFWADWPALRARTLALVEDVLRRELLTGARVDIVPSELLHDVARNAPDRLLSGELANLPCRIALSGLSTPETTRFSGTRVALLTAWLFVLAAIAAGALLLRAAMRLSERRGQFAAAVGHELRTPLTTLCMYTEMLAGGMVQGEEARAQYVATLQREAARLRRIVENVLGYARLDRGDGRVRLAAIGPDEIQGALVPALRQRARAHGVDLKVAALLPADAAVTGDAQALEQILANLVDNACLHGAAPVSLSLFVERAELVAEVSDCGPGVPPGHEREIFAPFRRAGDPARSTPGMGLGLALARALALDMGGERALVRGPASGATFRLRLPLARRAKAK